jgi:hypothetical protein
VSVVGRNINGSNRNSVFSRGTAYDYLPYAVSADGRRFLIPRPVLAFTTTDNPPSSQIAVVSWTAALKK